MKDPEPGMTQVEFLESMIPDGEYCAGCENIVSGKCSTWGQKVITGSKKCKWCVRNKYLGYARDSKGRE